MKIIYLQVDSPRRVANIDVAVLVRDKTIFIILIDIK